MQADDLRRLLHCLGKYLSHRNVKVSACKVSQYKCWDLLNCLFSYIVQTDLFELLAGSFIVCKTIGKWIVQSYVMETYLVMLFLISHHSLCVIAGSCRLCCCWEQQVYTGWAYYLPEFHREGSRGWYGGGWVIYIFLQIKLFWVLNL